MAHKYQYTCEGTIRIKREDEDFTTFVYVETNLYEATIQEATEWFEGMLSKYAACYGIDSKFSQVGFEVTSVQQKD